jgi:hypothetical protein
MPDADARAKLNLEQLFSVARIVLKTRNLMAAADLSCSR